jgi:NADH-quinone oxidoreductase subunit J
VTTRPELKLGSHLVPGVAAVALFAVMAAIVLGASFPTPEGFPEGANITASIGYAMFDIAISAIEGQTLVGSESFLVSLLVIAVVLDAALGGAIMLARRETEGGSLRTVLTDGGRRRRGDEGTDGRDGTATAAGPVDASPETDEGGDL